MSLLILIFAAATQAQALICHNDRTTVTFDSIQALGDAPLGAAVNDGGITGRVTCQKDNSTDKVNTSATCFGNLFRAKTGFAYDPVEIKMSYSAFNLVAEASIASTFPDGKTPGPFTGLTCDSAINAPSNNPPLCGHLQQMCSDGSCLPFWAACPERD